MGEFSFVKLEWHQPVALEHYSIVIYIALKPNANRLPIACNGTAKQQKSQTKLSRNTTTQDSYGWGKQCPKFGK